MISSKGTAVGREGREASAPVRGDVLCRNALGCALQLAWLPVARFATHADWAALPLFELKPLLAFLIACALTSVWCFRVMGSLEERPRWMLGLQGLALLLGLILAVLGSRAEDVGSTLMAISFFLLGSSFALGSVTWERSLATCTRKEAALAVLVMLSVLSFAFSASARMSMVQAVSVAGACSVASILLWKQESLPARDEGLKKSKLFELERTRLLIRFGAAFFLLGICSGVMLGLFASGIPTAPEFPVSSFAFLGVVAMALSLAGGWLRKREFDFLFTFALLMLFALAAFFPINPGTKLNQHLSLVLGEAWMVVLVGNLFLVSWSVDTLFARIGGKSIGIGQFALFGGLSTGALVVGVISKTAWFLDVFRVSHDGIVFVTTCGLMALVTSYVCTNILVKKDAFRAVELLAKGRFASSLQPLDGPSPASDQLGSRARGPSGRDIMSRCRDLALEKGLTPREFEVLVVLAHGNSLARVQSELVISEGTAITHRRNIYRKLDVHSKQELLDYVFSWEGERRRA